MQSIDEQTNQIGCNSGSGADDENSTIHKWMDFTAKILSSIMLISTHPALADSLVRNNVSAAIKKRAFLTAILAFSLAYVYTKSALNSIIAVCVFFVIRNLFRYL